MDTEAFALIGATAVALLGFVYIAAQRRKRTRESPAREALAPAPQVHAKQTASVFAVLLAIAFLWLYFGGGLAFLGMKGLDDIHEQVARDAVEQYNMTKRSGTPIDVCVRAGFVAEAYLQAKNEQEYSTWKRTETADCRRAGLPR